MSPPPHDRRWLFAVLILALGVRVGVAVWRADQLTVDRDAYLGIADNLVEGRGYSSPGGTTPTAFRPPLYPLLLATGKTVLPTNLAVAGWNILAGVLTAGCVCALGRNLGLGQGSYFAGMLVAVDPLLLNATPQPMTEVVFTALTTGWLWSVTRNEPAAASPRWGQACLAGILFGLAALCRPTLWPLAGLLAVAWLVPPAARRGLRRNNVLMAITATALVVAPWVVRNQWVFGKSLLTTTHGGYTLLLANNPVYDQEVVEQPWGTTWSADSLDRWQKNLEARIAAELGPAASEFERDAWMSREARRFIRQNPARFLRSLIHRVRSFWSIVPHGEGQSLPAAIRAGVASFYAVEILAAIAGCWRITRRRELSAWLPCLLLLLAIQGVHLAYWTDARMRTPVQPVLALFAAACFLPANRRTSSPQFNSAL